MDSLAAAKIVGELFASYPDTYVDANVLSSWVQRVRPWEEQAAQRAVNKIVHEQPKRLPSWGSLAAFYRAERGPQVAPPGRQLPPQPPMTPEEIEDLNRRRKELRKKLAIPDDIKSIRVKADDAQMAAAHKELENIRARAQNQEREHGREIQEQDPTVQTDPDGDG